MPHTSDEPRYRQSNLRLTALLLAVWFTGSFVSVYFARDLDFELFGWPFSFWMAAQGGPILYCLIIWTYAAYTRHLDRKYGVPRDE